MAKSILSNQIDPFSKFWNGDSKINLAKWFWKSKFRKIEKKEFIINWERTERKNRIFVTTSTSKSNSLEAAFPRTDQIPDISDIRLITSQFNFCYLAMIRFEKFAIENPATMTKVSKCWLWELKGEPGGQSSGTWLLREAIFDSVKNQGQKPRLKDGIDQCRHSDWHHADFDSGKLGVRRFSHPMQNKSRCQSLRNKLGTGKIEWDWRWLWKISDQSP
jgi:hypothetical protein